MVWHVVKIQAAYRGYLLRRRQQEVGRYDKTIDESFLFINAKVKQVYLEQGPFLTIEVMDDPDLINRAPFHLHDGTSYYG